MYSKAEEVGKQILKSIVGKTINEFSFTCYNQTKTLLAQANNAVKIGNTVAVVPLQLLFKRITRATCESNSWNEKLFAYEMTSFPTSMFESPTQFRPSAKSELADEIWKNAAEEILFLCQNDFQYVLDGVAILHIIPWQRGTAFPMILKTYADHINKRYRQSPMLILMSTMSLLQKTWSISKKGSKTSYPTVEFTPET